MTGSRRRALAWGLLLATATAGPVGAQSTLTGTVLDDSTGAPVPGVEVVLEGSRRAILSGASGRFLLGGLSPGQRVVLFRLPGYAPLRVTVQLGLDDTTQVEARMRRESAQQLDSVTVTARPSTRGVGVGREAFEERRARGFGIFIDSTLLRRSEHRRVADILWGLQGVRMIRGSRGEMFATNGRGATSIIRGAAYGRADYCYMTVLLDGNLLYRSEGRQKLVDFSRDILVSELAAVEVYRSAAEVPGEFSGASGACGVILLWSTRGR